MRILTCYNNIMHPGIAKLVSRLVWEHGVSNRFVFYFFE